MLLILSISLLLMSLILIGYNWRSHPQTILIAGIFVIYALYSLLYYFTIDTKNDFGYALMFGHLTPFWYLPGALLFLYYRSTLCSTRIFTSWKDGLHFIPSLAQIYVMFPFYRIPFDQKLQIAHLIHENPDLIYQYAKTYTMYTVEFDFAARPILFLAYIIACLGLLYKYSHSSHNHRYTLRWLRGFLLLLFLENIVYSFAIYQLVIHSFGFSYQIVQILHQITGAALFVVPIFLLCFFPQILYGNLKASTRSKKPNVTPSIDVSSFFELSARIEKYVLDEQVFLNPNLEISDISFALKVPRHHIAYCFTNVLKQKFTSYKNRLRVEHAIKLLENGESALTSMDGIGAKSGFKSRSAFYETFKVETGMTPNQFLKNQSAN
jgi:AraC-like DNA-binding protein